MGKGKLLRFELAAAATPISARRVWGLTSLLHLFTAAVNLVLDREKWMARRLLNLPV